MPYGVSRHAEHALLHYVNRLRRQRAKGMARVASSEHLVRSTLTELGEYALFLHDAIHA